MQNLIVPVYLNQKIVFDLIAMLKGGIATVTNITTSEQNTQQNTRKMSSGFGLSEAFSTLLKIDISGEKEKTRNDTQEQQYAEERVHTPASLLYELRKELVEKQYLKILNNQTTPVPGDFIEFEGHLKRNPITETLDSFIGILDIVNVFNQDSAQQAKKGAQGKPSKQNSSEMKNLKSQMLSISESLKAGNTIDLTSTSLTTQHKAIITLETSYLNDPFLSDIVDGQFKVIGKITRSVNKDETISLIRKTALSKMPPSIWQEVLGALTSLGEEQSFNIPNLEVDVAGPAFQILPIAIYA